LLKHTFRATSAGGRLKINRNSFGLSDFACAASIEIT